MASASESKTTLDTQSAKVESKRESTRLQIKQITKTLTDAIDTQSQIHKATIDELAKPCNAQRLLELQTTLPSSLDDINAMYDKLTKLSEEPNATMLKCVDRLNRDKQVIFDQAKLLFDKLSKLEQSSSHAERAPQSAHSVHSFKTRTSSRSRHSKNSSNSYRSAYTDRSQNSSLMRLRLTEIAADIAEREELLQSQIETNRLEKEIQEIERKNREQVEAKKQEITQRQLETEIAAGKKKQRIYQQAMAVEEAEERGSLLMMRPASIETFYTTKETTDNTKDQKTRLDTGTDKRGPQSEDLVKSLVDALTLTKIPAAEPAIFKGNPLEFNDWIKSFENLIGNKQIKQEEKLHHLKRYVDGPAKEAITGYFLLDSEEAYEDAMKLLKARFGQPFVVSQAFRERLAKWPNISVRDAA